MERDVPHAYAFICIEDNQAMMACARSGRNPTMRYLGRTHRVSVAWLKEIRDDPHVRLVYEETQNNGC
jgi:hypothetical protein